MADEEHRKAVIGSADNFWLYSSINGFDLTHPSSPDAEPIYPRVPLQTTSYEIEVDPAKTALVIIDMQNFFLSPNLGRPKDGKGIRASEALLKHAIPACRQAGIRIIWLNWGLTQHDIDTMPPATLRAFGFSTVPSDAPIADVNGTKGAMDDHGVNTNVKQLTTRAPFHKDPRLYRGLGSEVGPVELDDGTSVDGGRLLMRDQWNSALYPPLEQARQEGLNGKCAREDVWIHKNRMSGLWGGETDCTKYLEAQGIRTLLFAGVNTDQCVAGSLMDAFAKGFDCILLNDGSATTSPEHSQQCIEYNSAKTWGFMLNSERLAEGCRRIRHAP